MTVLVNICLAVCYGAYVCYLAVLDCECELCNCSIAVGSYCLLQAVLAVFESCELSAVALKFYGLVLISKSLSLRALANCYVFESCVLIFCCEYESCLSC